MMSKPDADMEGTICENCGKPINDHLPEELEECLRTLQLKKLKDGDLTQFNIVSKFSAGFMIVFVLNFF